jgi:hypothetical protein
MAVKIEDVFPLEEGTAITGGETFEEFSAGLPDNAKLGFDTVPVGQTDGAEGEGFGLFGNSSNPDGPEPTTPARKALKMSKKMKAAMKKIQDKVSSFPILYFKGKAKVHPEWQLDQDEEEIITDSLAFLFEVLDINFEIEQLNITLTSIWWVIMYPVCAIGMIFVSHLSAAKIAHPEDYVKEDKKK